MFDRFRATALEILLSAAILAASSTSGGAQATTSFAPADTQQQLAARSELNSGVEAFKDAHYSAAVSHFRRAVELAPSLPMAKAYLGTALAQNVVPGLDTPENLKAADDAIAVFLEALQMDPADSNSMKQIAGIHFQLRQLNEAKEWQKKVLTVEPRDADAAYAIGVIDWTQAHDSLLTTLTPRNVYDDGEGNLRAPAEAISRFREQNAALVDEGILYLRQAMADRPDYDDAMQYMNLVLRLKATVDRDSEPARKEDLREARDWSVKARMIERSRGQDRAERPLP